jgi:hypothetical protein
MLVGLRRDDDVFSVRHSKDPHHFLKCSSIAEESYMLSPCREPTLNPLRMTSGIIWRIGEVTVLAYWLSGLEVGARFVACILVVEFKPSVTIGVQGGH